MFFKIMIDIEIYIWIIKLKCDILNHLISYTFCCVSEWSAPSAIGIAGLGGGFEIGCEVYMYYFYVVICH